MSTETKIDVAALRALLADYTKAEAALDAAGRDAEMPVVFAWRNARTAWWDALVAAGPALLDLAEGAGGLVTGRTFDPETLVLALDAATTRAEAAEREVERLRDAITTAIEALLDTYIEHNRSHNTVVEVRRSLTAALAAPRDDAESTTRSDHE